MSKMSNLAIEKQNSVVDLFQEHPQHNTYQENCSECFKNVKEFDGDEEEFDCELCRDRGFISSGFEDDNNEFNKTGSRRCECNIE